MKISLWVGHGADRQLVPVAYEGPAEAKRPKAIALRKAAQRAPEPLQEVTREAGDGFHYEAPARKERAA